MKTKQSPPEQPVNLFSFDGKHIRAITDDKGNPWFIAKDVFAALEMAWAGSQSLDRIKLHWKMSQPLVDPSGRTQNTWIISEPAVYKLAFRSNKEEAERFTDWLAEEVLPSIRKTGEYRLLLKALLRPEPAEWERRFPPPFYEALCRLFGWTYTHHTALPNVIGQITRRWVYQVCMPDPVLEEMDARRGSEKLHQWLTEEGAKSIIRQIDAITITARQSTDYRDFDARCGTLFGTKDQQLSLLFPLLKTAPQLPPH